MEMAGRTIECMGRCMNWDAWMDAWIDVVHVLRTTLHSELI